MNMDMNMNNEYAGGIKINRAKEIVLIGCMHSHYVGGKYVNALNC
jgi:hypothetical protein